MGRVIAIANQKGGVGKSSTVLSLSVGLSRQGLKVLMVDIDPQSDLSISSGTQDPDYTIDDVMNGRAISKSITKLDNKLDIIPATSDLKKTQLSLTKPDILNKAINDIKKDYDVIIIDTSPGISILTVNALISSDLIIIPIEAEFYSLRGLRDFQETIEQLAKRFSITPETRILITKVDKRRSLTADAIKTIEKHFKDILLKTQIRECVKIPESQGFYKSIYDYSPGSHAEEDYLKLTSEIKELLS